MLNGSAIVNATKKVLTQFNNKGYRRSFMISADNRDPNSVSTNNVKVGNSFHTEVSGRYCGNKDCSEKWCKGLCGDPNKIKSFGHYSSKNTDNFSSKEKETKTAHFIDNFRYDGKNDSQYFIQYEEPEEMSFEKFNELYTNNPEASKYTENRMAKIWEIVNNKDKKKEKNKNK